MFTFFSKFKGGAALPPIAPMTHILWSWAGGVVGISIVGLLTTLTPHPFLMAPLGATAVLAFGIPDSPLAQPRNIIGGHVLTALIGLILLTFLGNEWWAIGLAVGTAIAVMQVTRTVHPPAGANPIVIMLAGAGWEFILFPVTAGAVALAICAALFNNLSPHRKYPTYWI